MRAGRVTASNFHAACHTSMQKPSISLLKRICTPTHMKFTSQATDWGTQHEEVGRVQYVAQAVSQHENFECQECGLVLSSDYPVFGASPDGLVQCKCCGLGCLEVNCPFVLKHGDLCDVSCLTAVSGEYRLNRSNRYFYQIQMQMFLTGRRCCDFVIWGPRTFLVERVYADEDIWQNTADVAQFSCKVCHARIVCEVFFTEICSCE